MTPSSRAAHLTTPLLLAAVVARNRRHPLDMPNRADASERCGGSGALAVLIGRSAPHRGPASGVYKVSPEASSPAEPLGVPATDWQTLGRRTSVRRLGRANQAPMVSWCHEGLPQERTAVTRCRRLCRSTRSYRRTTREKNRQVTRKARGRELRPPPVCAPKHEESSRSRRGASWWHIPSAPPFCHHRSTSTKSRERAGSKPAAGRGAGTRTHHEIPLFHHSTTPPPSSTKPPLTAARGGMTRRGPPSLPLHGVGGLAILASPCTPL